MYSGRLKFDAKANFKPFNDGYKNSFNLNINDFKFKISQPFPNISVFSPPFAGPYDTKFNMRYLPLWSTALEGNDALIYSWSRTATLPFRVETLTHKVTNLAEVVKVFFESKVLFTRDLCNYGSIQYNNTLGLDIFIRHLHSLTTFNFIPVENLIFTLNPFTVESPFYIA